jgi:hypothetical protein
MLNQDHQVLLETYIKNNMNLIYLSYYLFYQALRESFHKSFFLVLSSTKSARPLIETSLKKDGEDVGKRLIK